MRKDDYSKVETLSREGYCSQCGRHQRYLMASGVCPVCDEDAEYVSSRQRESRRVNLEAKRKVIKMRTRSDA